MAGAKGPLGVNPDLLGSGTANIAAKLLELRRKHSDAMLAGDWEKADSIAAQILEAEQKKSELTKKTEGATMPEGQSKLWKAWGKGKAKVDADR
jgi:hypothetical protein